LSPLTCSRSARWYAPLPPAPPASACHVLFLTPRRVHCHPMISQRLSTMKESDEKPGTITPFIDHCQVIPAMRDVLNWMAHPTFCPTIVESMLEYQKEVAYKKPQPVPQPGKKAKRRKVTVQPVVFEDDFEQEN